MRAQMEDSFGTDFSRVRVHQGGDAAALNAVAYAHGDDVFFRPGAYDPGTTDGLELIGHELAHVVQQRGGRASDVQAKPQVADVSALFGRTGPPRRRPKEADSPGMRITRTSAATSEPRPSLAARLEIGATPPKCIFAFVAASADLDAIAAELTAFQVPVIACTTAGQIGPAGFEVGDVTAAAVFDELDASSFLIASLADIPGSVAAMAAEVEAAGVLNRPDVSTFAVILIDGLSGAEERLMAALSSALPGLTIAGGSASDDLQFTTALVFHDGRFRSGAAVLHVFTTPRRVTLMKTQHHVPTDHRLIVTAATPATRTVQELNGEPAAAAYAEAIGVDVANLKEGIIAQHPLMLRIGGEYYIRSVRAVNADGSLALACAIEQGLVLRLGESAAAVETLADAMARATTEVGECVLTLAFDCIGRRLEFIRNDQMSAIGGCLAAYNAIGFSTFGEQCNSLHANQTFTGFMLGAPR